MIDELLDMAGGNRRLADNLHRHLLQLADSGNEKLRELARAVLDGASLRELALSETYGAEIGSALDRFWTDYQSMTSEERAAVDALGEQELYG